MIKIATQFSPLLSEVKQDKNSKVTTPQKSEQKVFCDYDVVDNGPKTTKRSPESDCFASALEMPLIQIEQPSLKPLKKSKGSLNDSFVTEQDKKIEKLENEVNKLKTIIYEMSEKLKIFQGSTEKSDQSSFSNVTQFKMDDLS